MFKKTKEEMMRQIYEYEMSNEGKYTKAIKNNVELEEPSLCMTFNFIKTPMVKIAGEYECFVGGKLYKFCEIGDDGPCPIFSKYRFLLEKFGCFRISHDMFDKISDKN